MKQRSCARLVASGVAIASLISVTVSGANAGDAKLLIAANSGINADDDRLLIAANSVEDGMRNAWNLYNQRNFVGSADAFEIVLRTAPASARLYYYAGLANNAAGRGARARQLFTYVTKNFGATPEGQYAQKMLGAPDAAATPVAAGSAASGELPESVKASLSPEMQALLGTDYGKEIARQAMAQHPNQVQVIRKAESQGVLSKEKVVAAQAAAAAKQVALAAPKGAVPPPGANKATARPFTAQDIARDGAAGIDQSRFPNCWFEASMAALAQLPRGQRLMANMIRYGDKGGYVVRFPNDGVEYVVTEQLMDETDINDKAKWASILECAEVQKFPDNKGANGIDSDQSRLEIGLGCITGCKAEIITPNAVSVEELSSFIGGAVKSQNPIVCATYPDSYLGGLPRLVVGQHAYTITGLDPARGLVVMRNPHGKNARRFALENDSNHNDFEQLADGAFKISLPLFQKYFYSVARSFI